MDKVVADQLEGECSPAVPANRKVHYRRDLSPAEAIDIQLDVLRKADQVIHGVKGMIEHLEQKCGDELLKRQASARARSQHQANVKRMQSLGRNPEV